MTLVLIVAAIGALSGIGVIAIILCVDSGRGEVADVPEVEDIPQTRWQPCRLNADAHWCFQPPAILAGSDLIDAQVPGDAGEQMATEIETYLRSIR